VLVDLIQAAAVVADHLELGQDVPHVPLLFDLLVEEPLEEGQRGVVLLRSGEFVDRADGGGNPLFVAEAGLKSVMGRFVIALGFAGMACKVTLPPRSTMYLKKRLAWPSSSLLWSCIHLPKPVKAVRSKYAAMPR
jgi:hypothetical protein